MYLCTCQLFALETQDDLPKENLSAEKKKKRLTKMLCSLFSPKENVDKLIREQQEHDTEMPGGHWDKCKRERERTRSTQSELKLLKSVSGLPADIEIAVLSEQDISYSLAVKQQIVLDISGFFCWADGLLILPPISGEAHFEVAQSTAGHKALKLLPVKRARTLLASCWDVGTDCSSFVKIKNKYICFKARLM